MIRINLLPVKAWKQREATRRQVSIFALTLVLLIGLMGLLFGTTQLTANHKKDEVAKLKADDEKLKKGLKELDDLKKEEQDLQNKFTIIADLEKRRMGPVKLLDKISQVFDKINRGQTTEKAWIGVLRQAKDKVILQGFTFDNETIAQIMTDLEATANLKNVELEESQETEKGTGIKLLTFSINAVIDLEEPTDKSEKAGKGTPAGQK